MKKKFDPSRYKATRWDSAKDKAEFANKLCEFLLNDCPKGRYTSGMYKRLCQMFGFIAHYDVNGFWAERFSGTAQRLETVRLIAGIGNNLVGVGDPTWTWSDVEKDVQQFVRDNQLVAHYQAKFDDEKQAEERAALERLQEKYPPCAPSTSRASGTAPASGRQPAAR